MWINVGLNCAYAKEKYTSRIVPLFRKGGAFLQIHVDPEVGGMTLNKDFFVDFGAEPDGPVLAHECRYAKNLIGIQFLPKQMLVNKISLK